jgi:hypothetical protein
MKPITRSLLLLCAIAAGNATAGIDEGLMAHYPMDGNARDATGHGYHGTVVGGARSTTDRFGAAAGAYAFDGIDDYINLGTRLDVPAWSNYTISVWFLDDGKGRPSCGYGTGYGEKILDKTVWFHDFYLNVCPDGWHNVVVPPPKGFLSFNTYESGGDQMRDGNEAIRDGQWHHVVVTKRGSHGEMWVDGARKDSSDNVRTVFSWGPLLVGYSLSGDAYQRKFFSGKIDDLRIYGRAVSADEVRQLYGGTSAPTLAPLQSLGDVNGDGTPEVAVLSHDDLTGRTKAVVKDAATGAWVASVAFGDGAPVEFATIPDANGNGTPELMLLASGPPKTRLRDSLSAQWLSTVRFDPRLAPLDVAAMPDRDGSGVSELALLGRHVGTGHVRVETRDALSGTLVAATAIDGDCVARQLLVLPGSDRGGRSELAVLCGDRAGAGSARVIVRDIDGVRSRNIWLDDRADYLQMALLRAAGDGHDRLALLRRVRSNNALQALVLDVTTGAGHYVSFDSRFDPVRLVAIPDMTGDGQQELALLLHRDNARVQVRDSRSGESLGTVWFEARPRPLGFAVVPDLDGNGAAELAVLAEHSGGVHRVVIKDVRSGATVSSIKFK